MQLRAADLGSHRRVVGALLGVASILVGITLATLVVFVGWKHPIDCVDASWPNTWVGDAFGHGDGPTRTSCAVPTVWTWLLSVSALLAPIGAWVAGIFASRKPQR